MSGSEYVLVTPAKNEGKYIGALLESIVAQTKLPLRWVIINDGSTDKTGEIVESFAKKYDFIRLINAKEVAGRSFGSKARVFSSAYETIKDLEFDFIGNLDGDVTLKPDYYPQVLERMMNNPRLGIAGGVIWDKTGDSFKRTLSNPIHTPGAIMMFRRRCFEDVGGYRPVTVGGVDSIAVLTARMKGWETRSFEDLPVLHHKPVGSSAGNALTRCFRDGLTEYHIGTHPLFAAFKAVRRLGESPAVLGSAIRLWAYFGLWVKSTPRDVSSELYHYVSGEQMQRLRACFRRSAAK